MIRFDGIHHAIALDDQLAGLPGIVFRHMPPAFRKLPQPPRGAQDALDDAMYALYVRQKLERARQAAKEGRVTSQEEMERRFLPHAR